MLTEFSLFLKQEMRPAPERNQMMIRYVFVTAIVLLVSMTLQIPSVALSIFMIFSVTKENTMMTLLAGRMVIIGAILAELLSLLLLAATLDWPAGRVTGAMLLVFSGMFFLRASRFGTIGYLVAVLSVVLQSEADTLTSTETLIRSCLWLLVAIVYPVILAMVVAKLMPAASAPRQFRSAMNYNWLLLEKLLLRLSGGKTVVSRELTFIPSARISRYQQFAMMTDSKLVAHKEVIERLLNTQNLVETVVRSLVEEQKGNTWSREAQNALYRSATICAHIASSDITNGWSESHSTLVPLDVTKLPESVALILKSLDELLFNSSQPIECNVNNKNKNTIMLDDWDVNPIYIRFAIKTVLATFLCYVFYNAVNWPGIRTCMTTVIILALPSLGASVHKAHLRIIGCLVGALLSILCIVFVLPWIDTITGLLVVSLPVVALSGWLAAGSTRIDYAGYQIVYAWSLAIYGNWGMTLDLTTIRDRIIGILIGVGVVFSIFSLLWPERSELSIITKLRSLFKVISDAAHLYLDANTFNLKAGKLIRAERQLSSGIENDIHTYILEHPLDDRISRNKTIQLHNYEVLKQIILIQFLCIHSYVFPKIRKSVLLFLDAVAEDAEKAATSLDGCLDISFPNTHKARLTQLNNIIAMMEPNPHEQRLILLCNKLANLLHKD